MSNVRRHYLLIWMKWVISIVYNNVQQPNILSKTPQVNNVSSHVLLDIMMMKLIQFVVYAQ